jgi:hypothetical protein
MARIRKTASIAGILKRTNYKLAHSTCPADVRTGMSSVLSIILMDAGLYAGFGYQTKKDMREKGMSSELPGVSYFDSRTGAEVDPGLYFEELTERRERGLPAKGGRYEQTFPDESRRFYYVHNSIHSDYRKLEKDGER